jgi:hypothetical protein
VKQCAPRPNLLFADDLDGTAGRDRDFPKDGFCRPCREDINGGMTVENYAPAGSPTLSQVCFGCHLLQNGHFEQYFGWSKGHLPRD